MIKKFLSKLVNWSERREDFAKSWFMSDQKDQSKLTRERHEQIMEERKRKYVSERKVPAEGEILGPSNSESKEEK